MAVHKVFILQRKDLLSPLNDVRTFSDLLENYDIVYAFPVRKNVDLEEIFREGNIGKLQRFLKYSLSVGDVIAVNGTFYRVEPVGYSILGKW